MLEFGNSVYIIDIDAFDKAITTGTPNDDRAAIKDVEQKTTLNSKGEITLVEVIERTFGKSKEVDAVKHDLLKGFVEYLMDYDDVTDDTLGAERALSKAPLGYKVVFNTLLHHGILKEVETN